MNHVQNPTAQSIKVSDIKPGFCYIDSGCVILIISVAPSGQSGFTKLSWLHSGINDPRIFSWSYDSNHIFIRNVDELSVTSLDAEAIIFYDGAKDYSVLI